MPQSIWNIVRIAIREYVNLNNTELIANFNGPVLFVRRTEDEIIAEWVSAVCHFAYRPLVSDLLTIFTLQRYDIVHQSSQFFGDQHIEDAISENIPARANCAHSEIPGHQHWYELILNH